MQGLRSIAPVRLHWVLFFCLLSAAWFLLAVMAVPAELRSLESQFGLSLVEILCGNAAGSTGFWPVFLMWVLMSAGMMAPTAVPAFAAYEDIGHVAPTHFTRLVCGYLLVWTGFSLAAAGLQVVFFEFGLLSSLGQSQSDGLTFALLLGAGLYQFSPLKEACLSRCRAPLTFFMQHWKEGPFRNGLRLGADCVGCCWALMLLGFAGGTMNLGFMALAMVLMVLEKLPDIGRYLTRPLGWALIAAAIAVPFF